MPGIYWAMTREKLAEHLAAPHLYSSNLPSPPNRVMVLRDDIGVIEINGTMNYEEIISQWTDYYNDRAIKQQVSIINSGGGPADGIDELNSMVSHGKKHKPQTAIVRFAGSSAFENALAHGRVLLCGQTAQMGGMGVIAVRKEIAGDNIVWCSNEIKAAEYREITPVREAYIKEVLLEHLAAQYAAIRIYRPQITDEQMKEVASGRMFMGRRCLEYNLADAFMLPLAWHSQGEIVEL